MFNSQARWDRHLPQDNAIKEEPIDVHCAFKKGIMSPVSFLWRGSVYNVKKITYRWQERRGAEILFFFSIDDGTDVYQIYLNNNSMTWRLSKV